MLSPLPVEPVQVDVAQAGRTPRPGQSRILAVDSAVLHHPRRDIARSSFRRLRSLIRSSIADINPECGISPKQFEMSDSATHRLPLQDSSINTWSAPCCDRLGLNPNEQAEVRLEIGSITSRVAV